MQLIYRGWFISIKADKFYAQKPSKGTLSDLFRTAETKEELYKMIDTYEMEKEHERI